MEVKAAVVVEILLLRVMLIIIIIIIIILRLLASVALQRAQAGLKFLAPLVFISLFYYRCYHYDYEWNKYCYYYGQ